MEVKTVLNYFLLVTSQVNVFLTPRYHLAIIRTSRTYKRKSGNYQECRLPWNGH